MNTTTRRSFVKGGALAAASLATAMSSKRVHGASERIRVGFIGVGGRAGSLLRGFQANEDVQLVALCDVYKKTLDKRVSEAGGAVDAHEDFRRLLDRKDIDAVVIVTPDHWHALQTILACQAGKDVYVEKPLTRTIREGRMMVEVTRKHNRVVQTGTQHRSRKDLGEIQALIQDGTIGKVTVIRAYRKSNMTPTGIGKAPDSDPPPGFNWDLWLGPAPYRPYRATIAPYKFRWWKDYSSQLGNWGVHHFDIVRILLDELAPVSVSAHGGNFAVDDDRTIPDTLEVTYEFASGRILTFGQYEACGNAALPRGGTELRGTLGTLALSWDGYEVIPESGGQMQEWEPRIKPIVSKDSSGDDTQLHIRNFLDCVKSREKPIGDVEEGHRSTTLSHLGNIAYEMKTRIEWDAKAERITNSEEANRLLHYDYREPWKSVA
ncbi:MAG: Gfo/Idh/MocA family oxidoreductase [Candidatus Omnitrophica bacterium]|nr:Inositol 2-dehydrogenase/D-chiro-inositol 3-dehydrogenase [bacterium]NUN97359.1 Gfo/Idh/MocA family oxidoreductase [Candidatus Omnitrophota bacterium]